MLFQCARLKAIRTSLSISTIEETSYYFECLLWPGASVLVLLIVESTRERAALLLTLESRSTNLWLNILLPRDHTGPTESSLPFLPMLSTKSIDNSTS
jgi:hypothetical protein